MERGYIKLYRCILDNPLWKFDPVTKLQAWLDLLLNANWKPGKLVINNCVIHIDRGQIGWSEITMSKRWSWSRNKVRRFLKMLEDEGNIVQQKDNKTTIITICNYDNYQSGAPEYEAESMENETPSETPDEAPVRAQKKSTHCEKTVKTEHRPIHRTEFVNTNNNSTYKPDSTEGLAADTKNGTPPDTPDGTQSKNYKNYKNNNKKEEPPKNNTFDILDAEPEPENTNAPATAVASHLPKAFFDSPFHDESERFAAWFERELKPADEKTTQKKLDEWALVWYRLRHIDKRQNVTEMVEAMRWAREDSFWHINFRTPNKLRQRDKNGMMFIDRFIALYRQQKNGTTHGKTRTNGRLGDQMPVDAEGLREVFEQIASDPRIPY